MLYEYSQQSWAASWYQQRCSVSALTYVWFWHYDRIDHLRRIISLRSQLVYSFRCWEARSKINFVNFQLWSQQYWSIHISSICCSFGLFEWINKTVKSIMKLSTDYNFAKFSSRNSILENIDHVASAQINEKHWNILFDMSFGHKPLAIWIKNYDFTMTKINNGNDNKGILIEWAFFNTIQSNCRWTIIIDYREAIFTL